MSSKIRELLEAHGEPERNVYFDFENNSFVPDDILEEMLPYYNSCCFGNPAITHKLGWEALEVVYRSKETIARAINSSPEEIVFTHCDTESNNLAIIGYVRSNKVRGEIVTSVIEHGSVLFAVRQAERDFGVKVRLLPVDEEGFILPEIVDAYVSKETELVSIHAVNHEIGAVQDIKSLIEIARDNNPDVVVHINASDALGRIDIDVEKWGADLVTISSYKLHGPRGISALYVRQGIKLAPLLVGQVSFEPLSPDIDSIPLIAGFRKAVELATRGLSEKISYIRSLRDRLMKGILSEVQDVLINGPQNYRRVCDNLNISFMGIEGEALTIELSMYGVYVSSGSACTSRQLQPSYILLAIGRTHEEAHGSILFKVSRYHREEDIDYAIGVIPTAAKRLRLLGGVST